MTYASKRQLGAIALVSFASAAAGALAVALIVRAEPGGATRPSFAFAGRLTPPQTGPRDITFTLRDEDDAARTCSTTTRDVPVRLDGTFEAPIELDDCTAALFDGSDVVMDIAVSGDVGTVVTGAPIHPVPYARYADRVGLADCPTGWRRATDATLAATVVLCRRDVSGVPDEVVRVGSGPSAFWIDRYEASIYADDGAGGLRGPLGDMPDEYPIGGGGQWTGATPTVFAISRRDVEPSGYMMWFVANEACRASGKRLPSGDEWLAAAQGTSDPGASTGGDGSCRTGTGVETVPDPIGTHPRCRSVWGAEDMIGNVWEWTADWHLDNAETGADFTWSVFSEDQVHDVLRAPRGLARGGGYQNGTTGGTGAVLHSSTETESRALGLRCVIDR